MTTKAQALAVALDHCEETGEVTPELRQRVADLVMRLDLVGPWGVLDEDGRREARYSLDEHSAPVAEISLEQLHPRHGDRWTCWVDGPGYLRGIYTADGARQRCDDLLRQQGRVLVGPTVRGPWRPKGAP